MKTYVLVLIVIGSFAWGVASHVWWIQPPLGEMLRPCRPDGTCAPKLVCSNRSYADPDAYKCYPPYFQQH